MATDRLFQDMLNADPAEREGQMQMFVRAAARALAGPGEIDLSSLRITIYDDVYYRTALDQLTSPEGGDIENSDISFVRRRLAPGLWSTIVIDTPDDVTTLTQQMLSKMPEDAETVWSAAQANIAQAVAGYRLNDHEWVWVAQVDGYYENAMMAVPEIWPDIARKIGGAPIVATPARGILLIVNNDRPETLEALGNISRRFLEERGHKLTDRLYRWTDAGWERL